MELLLQYYIVNKRCLHYMQVKVNCSLDVSYPANLKLTSSPLCTVVSDGTGQFVFYPLPPGAYSLVSRL